MTDNINPLPNKPAAQRQDIPDTKNMIVKAAVNKADWPTSGCVSKNVSVITSIPTAIDVQGASGYRRLCSSSQAAVTISAGLTNSVGCSENPKMRIHL